MDNFKMEFKKMPQGHDRPAIKTDFEVMAR
jgi:hypothetical protein